MLATILAATGSLLLAYSLYSLCCFGSNYLEARKFGLPCVVAPISPDNHLWIAFQTLFPCYLRHVPWTSFGFKYSRIGWEYYDKYETHRRLGDPWILVTPNRNWFHVTDAQVISKINSRHKDFLRPVFMLEVLNAFGPNISTAEGKDWQRQRKLTASYFNESRNELVWNESVNQASDMLTFWLQKGAAGTDSTNRDARTLTLHVLAYVAFQKQYPFDSTPNTDFKDAVSMTYRDAFDIILSNVTVALVMPAFVYSLAVVPKSWRKVGWAISSFRERMLEQVKQEKQLLQSGKAGSGTLVSNLVRAARNNENQRVEDDEFDPLTDSEVLGNIFVFNFAGQDTTAITLNYGLMHMAAHPRVQDWIHEEISHYIGDQELSPDEYHLFPKLQRCLAVLFETLRLYEPLLGTPRITGSKETTLDVHGRTYVIPANWMVVPNLQSVHTHPQYWSDDSLEWRPERWIEASDQGLSSEKLLTPVKGSYFPWSQGVRNCPGIKFAQVEFVATLARLFAHHTAEPVPLVGEDAAASRERVARAIKDSGVQLLLQMRDPESVTLRWSRRM